MPDFNINVIVDPSNASRGIRKVDNELNKLQAQFVALKRTIDQTFLFKGIDAGIGRLNELKKSLQSNSSAVNKLKTNTNELFNSLGNSSVLNSATSALNSLVAETRELNNAQRQVINANNNLNASNKAASQGFDKASIASRNYTNVIRTVPPQLNAVSNSAVNLRNVLSNAFQLLGVTLTIRELITLTDTFTNIQNRVKLTTNGIDQLNVVTDELFNISQRTRGSFEATSEVFTRVSLSTKELGLSQQETLDFTERLNKAVAISGASGIEASAGLLQLSQGLAVGRLQGDELRSVLEQLPAVADILAKQLGVTRGELKQLGTDGKITSKTIIDAFANANDSINADFAKTVPTLSQSFVVLRNSIVKTLGELDKGEGITRSLAESIIFLANNMDTLLKVVNAVSIALSVNFAKKGIGSALVGVRSLTAAIALNPFGALAIGITAAVSGLIAFSDEIKVSSDGLVTLEDRALATFQVVSEKAIPLAQSLFEGFRDSISKIVGVFGELGLTFDDVLGLARTFVNRYIGLFVGTGAAISEVFSGIRTIISDAIGVELISAVTKAWQSFVNFIIKSFNVVIEAVDSLLQLVGESVGKINKLVGDVAIDLPEDSFVSKFADVGANARDAFTSNFNRDFIGELEAAVSPALNAIDKRSRDIANQRLADEEARRKREEEARRILNEKPEVQSGTSPDFLKVLADLQKQRKLLQLNNAEREIQTQLLKIEESLKRDLTETESGYLQAILSNNQFLADRNKILSDSKGPQEEYLRTLEAGNSLLQEGAINAQQLKETLQATSFGSQIEQIRSELATNPSDSQSDLVQQQLASRLQLIEQGVQTEILAEQEGQRLIVEARRQAAQEISDIETARFSEQLQAGQTTFGALSSIAKTYAGEQSNVYKTLFSISKGFAVADSAVQIANALAKAANNPFPANLGAIATVASQTASIVSTIQGTQFAGAFRDGGQFTVSGTGGTDSQMVSLAATPGERVTVETPQQQRNSDANNSQQPVINVKVVNVRDASESPSRDDEKVIMNVIEKNASTLQSIIGRG